MNFLNLQKELANGAFVFIDVNYYTSNYAGSIQFDKDDTSTSFIQYHYTSTSTWQVNFLYTTFRGFLLFIISIVKL